MQKAYTNMYKATKIGPESYRKSKNNTNIFKELKTNGPETTRAPWQPGWRHSCFRMSCLSSVNVFVCFLHL